MATRIGSTLWTVGHGAASLDELTERLQAAGIALVVDVRRFPGSRRHPQFGAQPLSAGLAGAGIVYEQAGDLGGRRRVRSDSPNDGLRNEAFRAYADWMQTPEFATAYRRLIDAASRRRTAVLCAETPWWKCHRRLIADVATIVDGVRVIHLMGDRAVAHRVTDGAVLLPPSTVAYPAI